MSITASQFKTKAVSKTSRFFKCKRNKGKAYARLERLKDLLVGTGTHNRVPIGITQGPAGVVTFKRVEPTTPSGPPLQLTTSRKRKRPGDVPNSAATGNKNNLGVAPTDGAQMNANPNGNPEDKGFYENLPFHGMQNPPNKPVSVIAPFVQACNQPFNLSYNTNTIYKANAIKRHQSFHGFGNNDVSQQFYPMNVPSILYHLPQSFNYPTGSSTVGSLSTRQQQQFNRVQSFANLDQFNCYPPQMCNQFFVRNPFNGFLQNGLPRVVGRREIYKPTLKLNTSENKFYKPLDIRTTASGVNYDENKVKDEKVELPKVNQDEEEKRFGSLEIKKHKCYSPTFYSMRCKKHAKKRPVIYALPKKVLKVKEEEKNKSFEKLTDSIEISEQNSKDDGKTLPKPTPRCKRPKTELIYENISDVLKEKRDDLNSSNESAENSKPKISVTEALIHDSSKTEEVKVKEKVSPTNNIPTVKISPNFIKPKVESPKGALYMKIHAKRKSSPLVQKVETVQEDQPTTVNVPKMPLLDTATKLGIKSPNKQNAFYTLTTPHYKHAKPGLSQPYSSTIPHQKHMKLLPRALFQDQQLPKSKSFSSKTKQKKHFQIPLQKCHSFKFQTAESYFQPIKNVHEENLMRNGYVSDYVEPRRHKQKTRGPLVVRGSGDFHENLDIQECVRLQYPQPQHCSPGVRPNGVVYADLDMPPGGSGGGKKHHHLDGSASLPKAQKIKPKTEYATLKFNEVGQEIDV